MFAVISSVQFQLFTLTALRERTDDGAKLIWSVRGVDKSNQQERSISYCFKKKKKKRTKQFLKKSVAGSYRS